MMEKDNTKKTIMQICVTHGLILSKGSQLQKQHEEGTKEKCRWKKYNPKKDNPKYNESKIKKENIPKDTRSQSRILYDFAMSKIEKLYIEENNQDEVFALVKMDDHVELINVTSSYAIEWLTDEYSKSIDDDDIHSEDFYKKVTHTIKSKGKRGNSERVKINNRISQLDDSIWYDLGGNEWNAVKITKKEVKIVNLDNKAPLFTRNQSTYPQVLPKYDNQNALEELADLLKIRPVDKVVFIAHVVCFFLSSIPIPIMVFDGTAGSIKTTATATIKKIVDPSGKQKDDNVHAISKTPDDLIIDLYGEYMSGFDNVSYVDNDTSDIFCRAVTGATNIKRKLYANKSRTILKFMSKIVLNGIIPTLEYPDLQTRILNYERLVIDQSNLMLEKNFNKKLKILLPNILGNIFNLLSYSLQDYSILSNKIKPKTRMADFEVWGEIVSRRLGFEKNRFLGRYYEKLKEETVKTQNAYPIISAIQNLMNDKEVYEDSATELYSKLCYIAENLGINTKDKFTKFPKGSNKLINHLKSVESNLRTSGFNISTYYYTKRDNRYTLNSSVIKISKKEIQKTLVENHEKIPLAPLAPLAKPEKPKNQAQNQEKRAKGTFDGKQVPLAKNAGSRHEKSKAKGAKGAKGTFEENPTEKIIIKDLEKTKQDLRNSSFEVWNNGTVKCKLCNSKLDIPSAVNHTCKRRQNRGAKL